MIWGKKISYSEFFHQNLIDAVGRLQDDYDAALQTEKNLQSGHVNQRFIHAKTLLAKNKQAYLMRQVRLKDVGIKK
ncbi:hypothetical protein DLJ48_01220 [Oenococcus sicerae]|uniref:DUF2508 family protein n=1 Tax=Oenococcus sicerae TaxID=2203724 RepID=A0AAJ1RAY7_9LACO|nr:hypothetical protein [Oenococcus sicerae]MDN6900760.1 hypothetical protein [Oenococcus sicerae]QAS69241.1 hypothetical protein DLJ48_01220 [Oenococcus sicerae]VDK14649.1 hypothetical protein OAL24_00118 [Oenococcus sicerae]